MARTADQIRKSVTAAVKAVREDRDLSPEGKQRRLAVVYQQARTEMDKLRAGTAAAREKRVEDLRRRMFGNPSSYDASSAINFRDAMERAEAVTEPAEAERLLRRALATGDTALSKALGLVAYERAGNPIGGGAWVGLINEWAEVNGLDDELTEMSTLESSRDGLMEYALSKPSEVSGIDVERLAAEAVHDEPRGADVFYLPGQGGVASVGTIG